MKRFAPIFVLLAACVNAATYYVSPSGLNISPYDTWAKAANLPSTAVTAAAGATGPHTVHIGAGMYIGGISINHANHDGLTVTGAGRDKTILSPASGAVITGSVANDVTIAGMTLTKGGATRVFHGETSITGWVMEDVDFVGLSDHSSNVIRVLGGSITFRHCRVFSHRNTTYAVQQAGDAATVWDHCVFAPAKTSHSSGIVFYGGTGTAVYANCAIVGAHDAALRIDSGTVTASNCVLQGGARNVAAVTVTQTGGTLNLQNNHIITGPWKTNSATSGTEAVDTGNIVTDAWPVYRKPARRGWILPCVDDGSNVAYAMLLEAVLADYGMKGTFFTWTIDPVIPRAMLRRGVMEIGWHTRSHTNLTHDHAVAVTYAGADTNPTVELTAGGALQFRTTEGNDDADIDTTNASYDTIGEIVAAAPANWTLAKSTTNGQTATSTSDSALVTSLLVAGPTAVPCDLDFDRTSYNAGLFKDELLDPRTAWAATMNALGGITDPQTSAVYAVRTLACPYNGMDDDVSAAIRLSGYVMGRGNPEGVATAIKLPYGNDVDLYRAGTLAVADYLDAETEDGVRQKARRLAVIAVENGFAIPILSHTVDQLSIEEWGWACDEWSKFGDSLVVTSHQIFADTVRDSGLWTDDEDGTFSRTYTEYTDYRPVYDTYGASPLVNAGTNLGTAYQLDFDGRNQNAHGSGWEIGPYLYYETDGGAGQDTDCEYVIAGDINKDCIVNIEDLAIMASNWLICNRVDGDCP
ncbi:MAG: hypothetical protein IH624_03305 [Phycisphaerae bacterium]|nr:hypothetical protein [Phycisphaerae bacterium]